MLRHLRLIHRNLMQTRSDRSTEQRQTDTAAFGWREGEKARKRRERASEGASHLHAMHATESCPLSQVCGGPTRAPCCNTFRTDRGDDPVAAPRDLGWIWGCQTHGDCPFPLRPSRVFFQRRRTKRPRKPEIWWPAISDPHAMHVTSSPELPASLHLHWHTNAALCKHNGTESGSQTSLNGTNGVTHTHALGIACACW